MNKKPDKKVPYATVDDYIKSFPEGVQRILQQIRKTIMKAAPDATEGFSYMMPAYKMNGKQLVYFAGYKNHIGLYATPTGHLAFEKELSKYKQGKGSVQFPLGEPIPLGLISQIVKFRVLETKSKPL